MDAPDTTFDRDRGLLNTPPSPPMRVDRHSEAISGPAMRGSLVNLVDNTTADARDGSPASSGRNDLGDSATDRNRLSPPCGARDGVPLQDNVLEHAEALPVRSGQSNARLNKNVLRRDLKTDKLGLETV